MHSEFVPGSRVRLKETYNKLMHLTFKLQWICDLTILYQSKKIKTNDVIHIAKEEVYTKVIHADMFIPQVETFAQVALEFFHITSSVAIILVSQNNETAATLLSETSPVVCKRFPQFCPPEFARLKTFWRQSRPHCTTMQCSFVPIVKLRVLSSWSFDDWLKVL